MSETVYQNMPDHEIIRDILATYYPAAESREISPGVWEHTIAPPSFTPECIEVFVNTMHTHASDPDTILVSRKTMQQLRKARAEARRYHRVQLRKKRQRRTAQRRHNRGENT